MHFINEILTGHLVFELVKLPPPNGDEERPEKVSLLQSFQYSDILGIATSVCHQFDVDYNYDDNDDDQKTIPRPVLEVGRGVSRKKWINKSSR